MTKQLKVTTLAADLTATRAKIAEVKEKLLAPLEEAEAALSEQLVSELRATGLNTIRFEGHNFIRTLKTTISVVNTDKALEFAKQYPAVIKTTIDLPKVMKIIKPMLEVPAGFERKDTEFLSVRKANDGSETEVE